MLEILQTVSAVAGTAAALLSLYLVLYIRAARAELTNEFREWAEAKFPQQPTCDDRHKEINRRLAALEERD